MGIHLNNLILYLHPPSLLKKTWEENELFIRISSVIVSKSAGIRYRWWSFLVKTINGQNVVTIFEKILHHKCLIGSEGFIHLVRKQNFRKTNISYPLIWIHTFFGKFCGSTKWMTPMWYDPYEWFLNDNKCERPLLMNYCIVKCCPPEIQIR